MPNGVVATMDTVGYLYEPQASADRLIAYWLANRVDQSSVLTNVQSYLYVVGKHQNDFRITEFLAEAQDNLQSFLGECFEKAEVDVTAPHYKQGDKMFEMRIGATVYRDGKSYDVAKSVSLNGQTFELVQAGRLANAIRR